MSGERLWALPGLLGRCGICFAVPFGRRIRGTVQEFRLVRGRKGGAAMPWYVIYRHGWNERNQAPEQGLPEKMAVARMEASSPEEACRLAEGSVTLQAGQLLSAEPADEVDAREDEERVQ
jgi:hypothetical protein